MIITIIMTALIKSKSVQQLRQVWLEATEAGGSLQLQPGGFWCNKTFYLSNLTSSATKLLSPAKILFSIAILV